MEEDYVPYEPQAQFEQPQFIQPVIQQQQPVYQQPVYQQPVYQQQPVQTMAPFSMAPPQQPNNVYSPQDVRVANRAQYAQIGPDGTSQPIQPGQQQIAQPQYYQAPQYGGIQTQPDPTQQQSGYQPVGYQPAATQAPAYMNTPAIQTLQGQMYQNALQHMVNLQKPQSKGEKVLSGAKIFAQKIAPVIAAVAGGRHGAFVGAGIAHATQGYAQRARMDKLVEEQNAIHALNSANVLLSTTMRPASQDAKAQNDAAKFNATQQNAAAKFAAGEQGKNDRSALSELGRNRRFDTKETRQAQAQAFNQTHKINVLNNHMNEFDQIQDRLQRVDSNLEAYRKRSQLLQMRGQDLTQDNQLRNLAYKTQEDMLDHQMDVNKFNSKMELDIGKDISAGKLPPGTNPDKYMLEIQQANSIDPKSLGMSHQEFQGMMDQISSFGQQPQQPAQPQRPMLSYPPQQGMQAVPGQLGQPMPQQPQAPVAPQSPYSQYSPMFGAPQTQQGQPIQQQPPKKGVSMKAGKVPQAAQQMIGSFIQSSGNDPNAAKMRLIQQGISRGYSYQQAAAIVEQQAKKLGL